MEGGRLKGGRLIEVLLYLHLQIHIPEPQGFQEHSARKQSQLSLQLD